MVDQQFWHQRAFRPVYLFWLCTCWACLMGGFEGMQHWRDTQYVDTLARQIVRNISPADVQARVIALREYLRANISYQNAVRERREFFRVSASYTLQTGKGYCGEVSRAFIQLAHALGIRARRVYLYGSLLHVVAEVELGETEQLIVDCQNPPQIDGLLPLKEVLQRPEYATYSNLNVRRLGLNRFLTGVNLQMGTVHHLLESPHLLKAILWGGLAMVMGLLRLGWAAGRALWWRRRNSLLVGVQLKANPMPTEPRVAQEV